jgi:nucleotide-binding universal stress UspA family protein
LVFVTTASDDAVAKDCNLWVITKNRLPSSEDIMDAIRKILVPTDFSAHADEAFRVACLLAQAVGAEVVLFHVARPPAVVSQDGQFLADPARGKVANLWDRFRTIQPAETKVRVEHQMIVADHADAAHVLGILEKLGCDLIVIGSHGSSWLKHRLFGSVTEDVIRRARCPVMVVKAPAHQAALPSHGGTTKTETGHRG